MAWKKHDTSKEVANAIELLRAVLTKEYGSDYAFMVLGRGQLIGAANMRNGNIIAESNGDGDGNGDGQ